MKKLSLDRRTFLRGSLAGGLFSLALPSLEAMFKVNGTAYADGTTIPCRYGTFFGKMVFG